MSRLPPAPSQSPTIVPDKDEQETSPPSLLPCTSSGSEQCVRTDPETLKPRFPDDGSTTESGLDTHHNETHDTDAELAINSLKRPAPCISPSRSLQRITTVIRGVDTDQASIEIDLFNSTRTRTSSVGEVSKVAGYGDFIESLPIRLVGDTGIMAGADLHWRQAKRRKTRRDDHLGEYGDEEDCMTTQLPWVEENVTDENEGKDQNENGSEDGCESERGKQREGGNETEGENEREGGNWSERQDDCQGN